MATLNENIQRIENAKLSIKTAIESKGVTVPAETKIEGYSALIDSIPAGGGSGINFVLTGTGWENEPTFPVDVTRIGTIKEDLDYTRTKYSKWVFNPDNPPVSMYELYYQDNELIYAPLIETSTIKEMPRTYSLCRNLVAIPKINTGNVETMESTFSNTEKLASIPLLDTGNVINMNSTFEASGIKYLPPINVSKLAGMDDCFRGCDHLEILPELNTVNLSTASRTFQFCSKLKRIPLLNLGKATYIASIFSDCTSLVQVELTGGMLPECNCSGAFENVTTNGVLRIHTGNGITRESYNPIINVLPATWTVEEIIAQ